VERAARAARRLRDVLAASRGPRLISILDGHNDALLAAWRRGSDLRERNAAPHFDLVRAREGGFAGGFFAVFVPHRDDAAVDPEHEGEPLELQRAARVAGEMVEILLELERTGALVVARRVADLERALAGGPLTAILHLEGAEPLDPELTRLEPLVARGLRSIGLTWSRPNAFASGVPWLGDDENDAGLTPAGRSLVRACNDLGVLVDLSHLNAAGFADVAALSRAPLVATHSPLQALRPGPRGLTDEQLRAIAASGGIVGIPLVAELLRSDSAFDSHTPLSVFAEHVEHAVSVIGVDHVAIGSDLDGGALLEEVGDAAGLQRALDVLGWSESELRKLAHANWLRVLRATWQE
jgi:membrane dipeptidase